MNENCRLVEPFLFQKCENSRFYFMSMISFVGFNIISGWYQDKRFVGFLLPTSLFLFWTKKTLKWEIALGESRTALRTALSHMLFQTFGEGRNYSFGWDWKFFYLKKKFFLFILWYEYRKHEFKFNTEKITFSIENPQSPIFRNRPRPPVGAFRDDWNWFWAQDNLKSLTEVGFEPTPPKRLEP